MPSLASTQATKFLQRQRPRVGYEWLSWAKELRRLHRLRAWKSLRMTQGQYYEVLMLRKRTLYRYFGAIKAVNALARLGANKVLLARMPYVGVLELGAATKRWPEHAQQIIERAMLETTRAFEIGKQLEAERK